MIRLGIPKINVPRASGDDPNRIAAYTTGISLGNLPAARTEISDLATPRIGANAGYLFAVTDNPDNRLFAINLMGAGSAGIITIAGVVPGGSDDLESMASSNFGGFPWLALGFTGDNGSALAAFRMVTIAEPTITGVDQPAYGGLISDFTCEYPAGQVPAHKDCECILIDPDNGDILFINKRVSPIPIYRLPYALTYTGLQTLQFAGTMTGDLPLNNISTVVSGNNGYVVGGCINPVEPREILIKAYDAIYRWWRSPGESVVDALSRRWDQILTEAYVGGGNTAPRGYHANGEPQGEAVAFHQGGTIFYSCSEFVATEGSTAARFPLFAYSRVPGPLITRTFQHGEAGFTTTTDTFIDSSAPATPQGGVASLVADFDYSAYPTTSRVRQILLYWGFTGIPTNAIVTGAKLDLYINTEGLGMEVYRMLQNWGTNTVANDFAGRILHNDVMASSTLMGRVVTPAGAGLDTFVGFVRINLDPGQVQEWITNPANNLGVVVQAPEEDATGDGVQIDSMEGATQARKPRLTITYRLP